MAGSLGVAAGAEVLGWVDVGKEPARAVLVGVSIVIPPLPSAVNHGLGLSEGWCPGSLSDVASVRSPWDESEFVGVPASAATAAATRSVGGRGTASSGGDLSWPVAVALAGPVSVVACELSLDASEGC